MSSDKSPENANNTLKYSTEQFDKSILFIASGALGISFAFIKDIIPDFSKADCIEYLIYSWYTFAAVIFSSLIGHFISMQAGSWAVKNTNLSDEEYNNKIPYWNWPIRALNLSMIIAIFIGAILLINFISSNIS